MDKKDKKTNSPGDSSPAEVPPPPSYDSIWKTRKIVKRSYDSTMASQDAKSGPPTKQPHIKVSNRNAGSFELVDSAGDHLVPVVSGIGLVETAPAAVESVKGMGKGIPFLGPYSIQTICPSCRAQVMTETKRLTSCQQHICAAVLCALLCWCGCCLIPYCMCECQDVEHICPHCHAVIGLYNRRFRRCTL